MCNGSRFRSNHRERCLGAVIILPSVFLGPNTHVSDSGTSSEKVQQFHIVQLSRRSGVKCISETWLLLFNLNSCHHCTLVRLPLVKKKKVQTISSKPIMSNYSNLSLLFNGDCPSFHPRLLLRCQKKTNCLDAGDNMEVCQLLLYFLYLTQSLALHLFLGSLCLHLFVVRPA